MTPEQALLRIQFLEAEVQIKELDVANAELALRQERRKRKEAEAKLEREAQERPTKTKIMAVFHEWQARCNHPRSKLGPKRREAVEKMLKLGFTVDDLKLAILGASMTAFEKDGKRYDDLELICRDEVNVERFMAAGQAILDGKDPRRPAMVAADQGRALRVALENPMHELALVLRQVRGSMGQIDVESGEELFDCPRCEQAEVLALDTDTLGCRNCAAGPQDVIAALRRHAA